MTAMAGTRRNAGTVEGSACRRVARIRGLIILCSVVRVSYALVGGCFWCWMAAFPARNGTMEITSCSSVKTSSY